MRVLSELLLVGSAIATSPCEPCPGKKHLQCETDRQSVTGTFKNNCGKKCKIWECAPCDACEDEVEECKPGFESVLTGTKACDCDQEANVYGCQCIPCTDSGPEKAECGEDQYHMINYVNDDCNPPTTCLQQSCNNCEPCPIGYPFCGDGYRTVESFFQTTDCDKTCSLYSCKKCDDPEYPCPGPMECPDGQQAKETACEGDNCDECNCPIQSCVECNYCEDSKAECKPWEHEVLVGKGTITGECDSTCDEYACECSAPCIDEPEPSCHPQDKLRKWNEEDACGNSCKRYECVSNNPSLHLDVIDADMSDSISMMWGDNKQNWQDRMYESFADLVDKAAADYAQKNEVCDIYADWSPDQDEDEDSENEDESRGLAEVCKGDAKEIRSIFRQFISWTATFNAPCGENEGNEPVYANRLARKAKGLQERAVKRRCRFLKKQEA